MVGLDGFVRAEMWTLLGLLFPLIAEPVSAVIHAVLEGPLSGKVFLALRFFLGGHFLWFPAHP